MIRDYHQEYLRRTPQNSEKYLAYKREWMRKYRAKNSPKRKRKKLEYMREYHKEHWPELRAASAERVRAFRARKSRQADAVGRWWESVDRLEHAKRYVELLQS